MKYNSIFVSVLFTVLILAGCSKKEPAPPAPQDQKSEATQATQTEKETESASEQQGKLGQKAAPLEGLTMIKGSPITFGAEKVYVIEFWATWCGPCKQSIPHLTEIQKKFKDKGVTIIGISKETIDKVKPFVEEMGETMDYTVAVDTEGSVNKNYMQAFKQGGIPAAFIVNGKGNIVWLGHPMGDMEETLEQVLNGEFDAETYSIKKEEEMRKEELRVQKIKEMYSETEKKIEVVTALIEKNPDNTSLLIKRAEVYLGDSFTKKLSYRPDYLFKAVDDYKKAAEIEPENKYLAEQLEFFEAFNDRSDDRENMLKAFAEKYPDSVRTPFAAYTLYYYANEAKNYEDAVKYLTLADKGEEIEDSFREFIGKRKQTLESLITTTN